MRSWCIHRVGVIPPLLGCIALLHNELHRYFSVIWLFVNSVCLFIFYLFNYLFIYFIYLFITYLLWSDCALELCLGYVGRIYELLFVHKNGLWLWAVISYGNYVCECMFCYECSWLIIWSDFLNDVILINLCKIWILIYILYSASHCDMRCSVGEGLYMVKYESVGIHVFDLNW